MSSKVIIEDGFSFSDSLAQAKKNSAYYEEDLLVTVAERIISEMKKQGVSRSELARRMDVSPSYITKILRGHANLSLETLAKIAFHLELKWECLLVQQECSVNLITGYDTFGEVFTSMTQTVSLKKNSWGDSPAPQIPSMDEYSNVVSEQHTEYKEGGCELSVSA